MLRPFVLLLLMSAGMSQAGWVPPKDLDIHEIISAARDDRKSNNYIEALEKLIWIHEESLKYRPSFYGVRLSYAIAEWVKLSEIYEPAKQALLETSDKNKRG